MGQTYTIRKGIEKYSYEINEDGVCIQISSPVSKKEYKTSYEDIPANPTKYSERSRNAFWCMVVFGTLSIVTFILLLVGGHVENLAWVFWGAFAVMCTIWYIFSKKNYVLYTRFDETVLYFSLSKNKADTENIISEINTLKLKYLEAKIKRYLPTLGFDKVCGYIINLRENMILDDKGYEYLMEKAEELSTVEIVGFKTT